MGAGSRTLRRPIELLLCALLAAEGCRFASTSIERLRREPARYHGQEVTVLGRAGRSGWIPDAGVIGFTVTDDRDSILVLTTADPPAQGVRVRIHGDFRRAFPIGSGTQPVVLARVENGRRDAVVADPR